MIRATAFAVAAFALPLGLAATADAAPAVTVDKPCYDIQALGDTVTATATGFAPGDQVEFANQGPNPGIDAQKNADATGTATAMFQPLPIDGTAPGVLTEPLTATDDLTTPETTAATKITISRLAVTITPASNSLKTTKTLEFSGFTGGGTLYAHYLLGRHLVSTRRLGHLVGPCGTLKVRSRILPLATIKPGIYTIQWDAKRSYSARTVQKLEETVDVFATLHFGS